MAKVPASEQTRNALKRMLANVDGSLDVSGLVRQSVRLMVEEALEAEATERLGRGYYAHGESGANSAERGHRNGYRAGKLKSAEGTIEYAVPQVRGIEAGRARSARRWPARPRSWSAWPWRCTHAVCRCATLRQRLPTAAGAVCSAARRRAGCPRRYGPNTRRLRSATCPLSISPTSSWMASMNDCIWASRAKQCSQPGASPPPVTRHCWGYSRVT